MSAEPTPQSLQVARMKLLLKRPYLATATWAITTHPVPGMGTAGVDKYWRFYYDPAVWEKWSADERMAVFYHEMLHLLRDHNNRSKGTDLPRQVVNIAQDCEINDDLKDEQIKLPKDGVYPSSYGFPDHLLAEEYLELLRPKVKIIHVNINCGSGAHGVAQPWEKGAPAGSKDSVGDPAGGGQKDSKSGDRGVSPVEGHIIRRQTAEAIIQEANKNPGSVPAGLKRWADETLREKVDWREALRGAVRTAIGRAAGVDDYTFRRPARRAYGLGVVLPSMTKPLPLVSVVVDTSGSMGEKQLAQAIAEVGGVLKNVGHPIEVIAVDAAVGSKMKIRNKRQVELVGGGGTDMGVGLDAALHSRPVPDIVVILTDGYTPWPTDPPLRGTRVIVALLRGKDDEMTASEWGVPAWARAIAVPV